MKHITADAKQWLEKQGYSKKILFDAKELNFPGALVQELRLKPHKQANNHHHKKQTEIFYFFNNNGYFIVNGKKVNLKPGDLLLIEPGDQHAVVNDKDEDFLYLAFKLNHEEDDSYWE